MFFKIVSFFWQLLTFSTPLTTLGKNVRYAAACWLTAIESCVCVSLKSKIMTLNEAHFLYSILHDTTQTQGGLMHVHSFCSAARMHEHGAVAHLLWVHANNVGLSPAFEAWAPVLSIGLSPPPTICFTQFSSSGCPIFSLLNKLPLSSSLSHLSFQQVSRSHWLLRLICKEKKIR